ncbi:MAG: DUF1109 domain-containing protein, partial [Pseudomonadota bacterium]|nr:DUF1109 domain-containing protein [Pseudomonadota bacterium]
MSIDRVVDRLASDLKPIRRRRVAGDALILGVTCAVELALFLGLGAMRPDMPLAMEQPSFWWKLTSLGLIAAVGSA